MKIAALCALLISWLCGCEPSVSSTVDSAGPSGSAVASGPSAPSAASGVVAGEVVLLAGGDVSFGRMRGQRLLREPGRDDFAALRPLLDNADVRFINLESTITERGGRTQSPHNKLVFSAPPAAAAALARAHIDIVSLANNHAWDYQRAGLLETIERLEEADIAYVGASREAAQPYAPRVVSKNGMKLAFVAVTAVYNQALSPHPGKAYIADARVKPMVVAIKRARAMPGVDKVIVSYHGGYEYYDRPHADTRTLFLAAVAAGADVVLGHHPHMVQRVAMVDGKPLFYSLGNMLMRMVSGKPWTEIGMLARIKLRRLGPSEVWICPFRIFGLEPIPLAQDARRNSYQAMVESKLRRLQTFGAVEEPASAARLGPFGADGCAQVLSASEVSETFVSDPKGRSETRSPEG